MIEKDSAKYSADYSGGKDKKNLYGNSLELKIEIDYHTKREFAHIEILDLGKTSATLEDFKLYFKWVIKQLESAEKQHFKNDE